MSATVRDVIEGFQTANLTDFSNPDFASVEPLSGITFGREGFRSTPIDVAGFVADIELVDNLFKQFNNSSSDIEVLEGFLSQNNPGYFELYLDKIDDLQTKIEGILQESDPNLFDFMAAEFSVVTTAVSGVSSTLYNGIVSKAEQAGTHLYGAVSTIGSVLTPASIGSYSNGVGLIGVAATELESLVGNFSDFIELLADIPDAMQATDTQKRADFLSSMLDLMVAYNSQANRFKDLIPDSYAFDPKVTAVLEVADIAADFIDTISEGQALETAYDDGNLTQQSRNFLDDVMAFNSLEYAGHTADLISKLVGAIGFLPNSGFLVGYLTDSLNVLSDVRTQVSAAQWKVQEERFDKLSTLLGAHEEYQTLLGGALAEADRLVGGVWGNDLNTTGPLADVTAEYTGVLSQVNSEDITDGVEIQNLGAFTGSLNGGSGEQRAVLDYSGYAARGDDGYTLSFTPDAGGYDRIWDGTEYNNFGLSYFERYTIKATAGNDYIRTEGGNDIIRAGAGDDFVDARAGRDFAWLGAGDDVFQTSDLDDRVFGGTGFDTLNAYWSNYTTGVTLETGATSGQWQGFEDIAGTLTQGDDVVIFNGGFTGSLSGWTGYDQISVDYSGYAARDDGGYTLYFRSDFSSSYIWDGTANDNFSLSYFDRYTITATAGRDYIQTYGGNDIIRAGAGDDYVEPGAGRDFVWLGDGDDRFQTRDLDDRVFGGAGFDTLSVEWRNHTTGVTLETGATTGQWQGFEDVTGTLTQGDDVVIFNDGFTGSLSGWTGYDQISVDYSAYAAREDGGYTLYLRSGSSSSYIWDGTANDNFSLSYFDRYTITATAGRDYIQTYGGNDIIRADAGDDFVDAGSGRDFAWLGDGDDRFQTYDLDDRVFGGAGFDTLIVGWRNHTTGVTLETGATSGQWQGFEDITGTLTQGDDVVIFNGGFTGSLNGWTGEDQISVDYSAYAARDDGGYTLYFRSDFSSSYIWDGTANDNFTLSNFERYTITATAGNDYIQTGSGNDRVFDGRGNDRVYLNDGRDYVRVGGGQDSFDGGAGVDFISYYDAPNGVTINLRTDTVSRSSANDDTIANFENVSGSRTGDDRIYGTTVGDDEGGDNVIRTYGGNDRVFDYSGNDTVELGDGNDYVRVGGGRDIFDGGDGVDFISYYGSSSGIRLDLAANTAALSWARDDTVLNFEGASGSRRGNDDLRGNETENVFRGNGGEDRLLGRDGDDRLYGGDENDRLFGGNDNDRLYGDDGDDFLHGGRGTDDLYGGTGSDIFHFDRGDGDVTVHDFENNIDVFQFDNFSGPATASNQAFFDAYVRQQGNDVIFDFGADGTLIVADTTVGLVRNDFDLV